MDENAAPMPKAVAIQFTGGVAAVAVAAMVVVMVVVVMTVVVVRQQQQQVQTRPSSYRNPSKVIFGVGLHK